jgi:hypothetical protein
MSKRRKSPQKKAQSRKPGCHWSNEDSVAFVKLLVAKKKAGGMSENGFKASVFGEVAAELEVERPATKGVSKNQHSASAHWQKVGWHTAPIYLLY